MRVVLADRSERFHDRGQHGLKPARHRSGDRRVGGRHEVGDARDDTDGSLGPDLPQALRKNRQVATWDDLGRLQKWTGPERSLADVSLDVGVSDETIASQLRHVEDRKDSKIVLCSLFSFDV